MQPVVTSPGADTYAWCAATGGALTRPQWLRALRAVVRQYPALVRDLARLALDRGRPDPGDWVLPSVDDDVWTAVEAASSDQGRELQAHGLRTFWFGSLLAAMHGVGVHTDELLVAAAAHDVGLARPVPGEDFTLRSARAAVDLWSAVHGPPGEERAERLRDAVVAHTTPGLDPRRSPLGWAVQAGATADLIGLRLADLPDGVIDDVYRQHPQDGLRRRIVTGIRQEAAAVPAGRFALLRRTGFGLAVRTAPHRGR